MPRYCRLRISSATAALLASSAETATATMSDWLANCRNLLICPSRRAVVDFHHGLQAGIA